MSNSPLATYMRITDHRTSPRTMPIDRITIHCIVGQWTAKQGADYFATTTRSCSANYIVGRDGDIALGVGEHDRAWTTSSSANDNRAITIETASDTSEPYAVTDKAYNALIELCYDICKRNGKKKLIWFGDKDKTLNYKPKADEMVMTVHRWFANKSCPGRYLYDRHGDIAQKVTARLAGETPVVPAVNPKYPSLPFLVRVKIPDLNYRSTGSMKGTVRGQTGKGTFTIVETNANGWGRLKSGAGWIYLDNPDYCTIVKK